jgi:uncharacterized protein involved in copper resistance
MWIGTALLLVVAAAMPAPAAQDKPDANEKAAPAAEQKKTAADRGKKDASPPPDKSTTTAPKRVTDADGKTYEIRNTPFGPMKFPVKTEDSARETSADAFLKVTEEGDSLRFRRQTPFGVTEWVRKKSEFNDTEKQAWERELNKSKSSAPAETKEGK